MRTEPGRLESWLRHEDRRSRRALARHRRLQLHLRREFRGRVPAADRSAPVRRGPYLYYTRTMAGRELPLHCRRPVSGGAEELLLDPNRLAGDDGGLAELGSVAVSPDHRRLAFSWDPLGAERFQLRVLDLADGAELLAPVEDTSGEVLWAADSQTLFYITVDRSLRPSEVQRRRLGAGQGGTEAVLAEPDACFHLGMSETTDRRWLLFTAQGEDSNETWMLDARQPGTTPLCFRPRQPGVEYHLDHHADGLVVLTNLGAQDYRLLRGRVGEGGPLERWPELMPGRPGVRLEDFALAPGWVATVHRQGGVPRLRLLALDGRPAPREVGLGAGPISLDLLEDGEPEGCFRIAWSSPRHPWREERLDPASGRRRRLWTQRLPAGHRAADYQCRRLWARSQDGTAVPLTLVRRHGAPQPGPCLLVGYGAYGDCLEPEFDLCWLSLLDRGVSVALAHGRGGGELGEAWHRAGRGRHRPRSVEDFLACAEHLVRAGVAAPGALAASGASAGGLLVAAALNRKPELFRAVLLQAPFLDLLEAMQDPELPLTTGEYQEWGNPADPEQRRIMAALDPRLNLGPGPYPAVLVRTALHDTRVPCWQPARWLARLRAVAPESRPCRLRTEFEGGHGGPPGRFQMLREQAFDYAFLLVELGIDT